MSYSVTHIGDADGQGHSLTLEYNGDGIVILNSVNPDTQETQRIVMLEEQWMNMFRILLEEYGASKCLLRDPSGLCTLPAEPVRVIA